MRVVRRPVCKSSTLYSTTVSAVHADIVGARRDKGRDEYLVFKIIYTQRKQCLLKTHTLYLQYRPSFCCFQFYNECLISCSDLNVVAHLLNMAVKVFLRVFIAGLSVLTLTSNKIIRRHCVSIVQYLYPPCSHRSH